MKELYKKLRQIDEAVCKACQSDGMPVMFATKEKMMMYLAGCELKTNEHGQIIKTTRLPAMFVCHKNFSPDACWHSKGLDITYNAYAVSVYQEDINKISANLYNNFSSYKDITTADKADREGWRGEMKLQRFKRMKCLGDSRLPTYKYKFKVKVDLWPTEEEEEV
jgi:hypothetical protein